MNYEAMGYSRKGIKRGVGGRISYKITYVNVNRFKFVKVEENQNEIRSIQKILQEICKTCRKCTCKNLRNMNGKNKLQDMQRLKLQTDETSNKVWTLCPNF